MTRRPPMGRCDAARAGRALMAAVPAVALALALSACGGNNDEDLVYSERSVGELYNDAMDELMAESYEPAARLFDEVERQHPYSQWATKGQLMAAFAYYQKAAYAEALVALDRFIELHPAHENVDYAYYLRGVCYYEQITDVARDQRITERAKDALEELVTRFPDSRYADDAERKLVLVRDQLAGKEMEVGRFYANRGHYLAAINRFRTVVEDYETTSHVPEALHRLTEIYLALGVSDEAQKTAAVLGHNYPGSRWYKDSYALLTRGKNPVVRAEAAPDDRSFLTRTWDWIF